MKIEGQTFFIAIEKRKEASARSDQLAGAVSLTTLANGLDLDDLCAQVGQHHAAGGPHHHVGKFDDANALVWQSTGACHRADFVVWDGLLRCLFSQVLNDSGVYFCKKVTSQKIFV
jgi:hypothetical protein